MSINKCLFPTKTSEILDPEQTKNISLVEFGCVGAEIKWDMVFVCGLWFCGLWFGFAQENKANPTLG